MEQTFEEIQLEICKQSIIRQLNVKDVILIYPRMVLTEKSKNYTLLYVNLIPIIPNNIYDIHSIAYFFKKKYYNF